MAWRSQLVVFFALLNVSRVDAFCEDGMTVPNFTKAEIVEVIYAQAPLFSTSHRIGQALSKIDLFHSSIVLAQGAGLSRRYWTLEFGFMDSNPFSVMAPKLVANESASGGLSLIWNNDAKYCLSYGLLHGRQHWTTHLDIVMSVTVDHATRAFEEFVKPLNRSKLGEGVQYSNFRVAREGFFGKIKTSFVEDVTCNQGAIWFINYLATKLGNPIPPDFHFRGTVAVVNALGVKEVKPTDREWNHLLAFYGKLNEVAFSNKSHSRKLLDLGELAVERKFSYDPNARKYYEIFGNFVPWLWFHYDRLALAGPSFLEAPPATMVV